MPLPEEHYHFSKVSVKTRIYETIKRWIIEMRLKPGEQIFDVEIAEHFQVSRTPVREALQLLEMQKLVKTIPGKATIVTEIDYDNLEQLYQPMAVLQQLAVRLAIEKASPKDIENLKRLNQTFTDEIRGEKDVLAISEADVNFHTAILDTAGNSYIKDFCNTLWIHIQRLEYCFFREGSTLEDSIYDHEQLIQAFEMKDDFTASVRMKAHWDRTVMQIRSIQG